MTNEKASSVAAIWTEFAAKGSLPGMAHVSTARCIAVRIFWICIGVIVTFGAAYHLYTIIWMYMQYNYYTSISNDFDQPLEVGAIMFIYI